MGNTAQTRGLIPWVKGQSGNPKGGQKNAPPEVTALAREYTREAVQALVDNLKDSDPRIRHASAESLLDRGWGKAPQSHIMSSDPDAPMVQRIEWVVVGVPVGQQELVANQDPPRLQAVIDAG